VWRDPPAGARLAGRALDLDPAQALALRVRATALALDDRPEELPDLAARLRAVAPGRGWGDLAEGAGHVLRGEIALAAPFLAQAEADPDPDTRYTLAMVWLAAKRPAAAERILKALAPVDPAPTRARLGLAALMIDRGDYLNAEATLAAAMAADPADPAVYLQWARLCRLTARPAQARRMADLALRFGAGADGDQAPGVRE
jgi:tetratricopeptide (TPR) repeat protein